MKRRPFLIASAAAVTSLTFMGASANDPTLRVLLGKGDAQPIAADSFLFEGRTYRGTYSRAPDGSVINNVSLTEYLYSVVPREMPSSWPAAALAMQAICARTFVLQHIAPQRAYDVVPSNLNQLYEGVQTESDLGRQAVDTTGNMVLSYNGALAQAEYSSCCGGHTEAASDAWGGPPIAYLGGVVCPYCTDSPEYRWSRDIAFDAISAALMQYLEGDGQLVDLHLGAKDASGRIEEIALITNRTTVAVRGSDFRIAIGPQLMRSLLIVALSVQLPEGAMQAPIAHFEGAGNGHGVGLCQWGARGFALRGAGDLSQMASFYFPGTAIETWTNVQSQPTSTIFPHR